MQLEIASEALHAALERRYRPDQPHAPRGTPTGGRWIDDLGSASDEVHVAELGVGAITKHGIDQLIYRGVSPAAVLDALKYPIRTRRRPNMTTQYVGNDATVVLNDYGGLVTVWPR